MDDEIDLREYVRALLRHWRLIAGLTVAAALVAAGVSLLAPRTYQATAVVSTSASGIPAFAVSDAVLEQTIAQLGGDLPPGVATPAALRARLAAAQASGSTAVQLTAKDSDPEQAERLANAWAEALVSQVRAAQAANPVPELQAELETQTALLAEVAAGRQTLEWAIEDAAALRERLAARGRAEPALPADEAVLLILGLQTVAPAVVGLQFPMSVEPGRTVGDQIRYLDGLSASLLARRSVLEARAERLREDIAATQAQFAEAQIAALATSPIMVQASQRGEPPMAPAAVLFSERALPPPAPIGPGPTRNVLMATAFGLILGGMLAFGWEWWQAPPKVAP